MTQLTEESLVFDLEAVGPLHHSVPHFTTATVQQMPGPDWTRPIAFKVMSELNVRQQPGS